jgi:hypothetical protein
MVKRRTPSFLTPKKLLTKQEYLDYQMRKKIPATEKLRGEIEEEKKGLKKFEDERRYAQTRTGRLSSKSTRFLKGIQDIQRRGITRSLYERKTSPFSRPYAQPISTSVAGRRTGRVGRPRGTFDPRYSRWGGVYGYRKWLSQQRWKEKQEILAQSVASPVQRERLRQIQMQEQMRQQSPEAQVIPNTYGNIPLMKTIHQEINDYANLVD